MKKTVFSIAAVAAAFLLASCNKEEIKTTNPDPINEGEVMVNVSAGTAMETKATGIKDDNTDTKKINSLQVFAFDADGVLRAYENNTSGSSVSMKLNTGQAYTFFAVANNYGASAWKYASSASVTLQAGLPQL